VSVVESVDNPETTTTTKTTTTMALSNTKTTAAQRRRLRFGDILKKTQKSAAAEEEWWSPATTVTPPLLRRSIVFDKLPQQQHLNPNHHPQEKATTTTVSEGKNPGAPTVVPQPQVIRVKQNPQQNTPILPSSIINKTILHTDDETRRCSSNHDNKRRPSIEFVCWGVADSPSSAVTDRSAHNHSHNNISALSTTTTAMDLLQQDSPGDMEQIMQETKHEILESMNSTWSLECIQQCHDPIELQEKIHILEQPSHRDMFPGLLRATKERLSQICTNPPPADASLLQPPNLKHTHPITPTLSQLLLRTSKSPVPLFTSPQNSHRHYSSTGSSRSSTEKQQKQAAAATPNTHISTTSSSLDMSLSYSVTENNETGVDSMEKSHVVAGQQPQNVAMNDNYHPIPTMAPTPRKDDTALIQCHVAAIERLTHTIVEMRAANEALQQQLQEVRSAHAIQENHVAMLQSAQKNLQKLQNEWRALIRSLQKLTKNSGTSDWRVLIQALEERHSVETSQLQELSRRADRSERQLLAVRSELDAARRQWHEHLQQAQLEKSNLLEQIQKFQCDQEDFHEREQTYWNRIRRLQQLIATTTTTNNPEHNAVEYYRTRPIQTTHGSWPLHDPVAPSSTEPLQSSDGTFHAAATRETNHVGPSSIMSGTLLPSTPKTSATIYKPVGVVRPKTPAPFRIVAAEKNPNILASPLSSPHKGKPSNGKENEPSIPPPSTSKDKHRKSCLKDPTRQNKPETSNRRALAVISSGGRLSLYQKLQETRQRSPSTTIAKPTLEKLNIRPVIR
jgi:hypothetical protein